MKVSTDGILLGAWASLGKGGKVALDIGTGTGILSLMLAQRFSDLQIEALEIDEAAAKEANGNVNNSPWPGRIRVIHTSLQSFQFETNYDLIICNPPFYSGEKKSKIKSRAFARHQANLPLSYLMEFAKSALFPTGKLSMILPYAQRKDAISYAQKQNMKLSREKLIRYTSSKEISRVLLEFGQESVSKFVSETMTIQYKGSNRYTEDFIQLTRDFYAFMD
ncbi:MAG: methyltransferase [Bacteroidia bacterium]|nr:methyltransferase [Bacteroidia bacterium]